MKELGFEQLLPDNLQAPIIITFKQPNDPKFNFEKFYNALSEKIFNLSWKTNSGRNF